MTRSLLMHFPDGEVWDQPMVQNLKWEETPIGRDPFEPWHARRLSVVGLPEDIDRRWPDLLRIAHRGHMSVGLFKDFTWPNGLVEVHWWNNLYCEESVRSRMIRTRPGHNPVDRDLYRVLLRGVRDPRVLCGNCYRAAIRRGDAWGKAEIL